MGSRNQRTRRNFARVAALLISVFALDARAEGPRDLTLAEVMSKAVVQGRAIASRAKVAEAEGRLAEAKGAAYPQGIVTSFLGPSPSIECLDDDCTRTSNRNVGLDLDGVFGGVRVDVVQPLYTFGKIARAKRAARGASKAQEHLSDAVVGDIAVECAQAFYGLKLGRDLVWMLEDGQDQVQKALEDIRAKLDAGSDEVTLQDRLRLETFAAEIGVRLADARTVEGTALAAVRALVLDDKADIDKAPIALVDYALAADSASLVHNARAASPEILAAAAGVVGATQYEQFRSAQYWPDLLLVAGVDIARAQGVDDPPTAFASDPYNKTSGRLGLVLRWTVDPMAQRGRVAQAHAQTRALHAMGDAARSKSDYESARTHVALVQARAKVDAATKGERAAKGWLASVLQAEAIGTMESKDLVDAYIAFFTMRSHWLKAAHDWNLSVIVARKALGEYSGLGPRPSPQRFP